MKKTVLLVKSLVVMSFLFVSCNDNDSVTCPDALTGELSEVESAFAGKWVLTAIASEKEVDLTNDNVANPSKNIFEQQTACQKDVIYVFNADRTFDYKEGSVAEACTKTAIDGTWKYSVSGLVIVANCTSQILDIDVNDDSTEFSIESTYNIKDVSNNVISSKLTFTYTKAVAVPE